MLLVKSKIIFTFFIVIIINLWKYERMKVYVLVQRYIINFHYSYTIGCTGLSWLLDAFWHLSSIYGQ